MLIKGERLLFYALLVVMVLDLIMALVYHTWVYFAYNGQGLSQQPDARLVDSVVVIVFLGVVVSASAVAVHLDARVKRARHGTLGKQGGGGQSSRREKHLIYVAMATSIIAFIGALAVLVAYGLEYGFNRPVNLLSILVDIITTADLAAMLLLIAWLRRREGKLRSREREETAV